MARDSSMTCLPALALLAGVASAASTPPSDESLLTAISEAYAARASYADIGEIEITEAVGGIESTESHFFETVATSEDGVFWRLMTITDRGPVDRTVWRSAEAVTLYDGGSRQTHSKPSLAAAVEEILGAPSSRALLVLSLLVGGDDSNGLRDLGASETVSEPEPCFDGSECRTISASLPQGGRIRLRIETGTLWIHEVEVFMPDASGATRVRVSHSESALESGIPGPTPALTPPTSTELAPEPTEPSAPEFSFSDVVTVDLFTISARVVDPFARPITELRPEDLIVTVGKRELPVASVDWSGATDPSRPEPSGQPGELEERALDALRPIETEGRLIVIFLQNDFHPIRVKGQMKLFPGLLALVEGLGARDRVAVLSYYGHLKLWQDFTREKATVKASLRRAFFPGAEPGTVEGGESPSLLDAFDPGEARDIATSVEAMRYTADALAPLPGEKDIVFFGYGLEGGGSRAMLRALQAARATTFVLDTTQADSHSLGATLSTMAGATGGTYASSYVFANRNLHRIQRLLTGHHRITIDRSEMPDVRGDLVVRLRELEGTVLMKPLELK